MFWSFKTSSRRPVPVATVPWASWWDSTKRAVAEWLFTCVSSERRMSSGCCRGDVRSDCLCVTLCVASVTERSCLSGDRQRGNSRADAYNRDAGSEQAVICAMYGCLASQSGTATVVGDVDCERPRVSGRSLAAIRDLDLSEPVAGTPRKHGLSPRESRRFQQPVLLQRLNTAPRTE